MALRVAGKLWGKPAAARPWCSVVSAAAHTSCCGCCACSNCCLLHVATVLPPTKLTASLCSCSHKTWGHFRDGTLMLFPFLSSLCLVPICKQRSCYRQVRGVFPPPHPFFCFLPMPLFTLRPISFAVFTRSCGLNLSSSKDQEIYFPTGSDCEEVDNSLSTISVDVGKGIVGPLWDQEENWNLLKKWGEVIHFSCLNSSVILCCGAREDESELTLLIGSWWNEKGNTSIWMGSREK